MGALLLLHLLLPLPALAVTPGGGPTNPAWHLASLVDDPGLVFPSSWWTGFRGYWLGGGTAAGVQTHF